MPRNNSKGTPTDDVTTNANDAATETPAEKKARQTAARTEALARKKAEAEAQAAEAKQAAAAAAPRGMSFAALLGRGSTAVPLPSMLEGTGTLVSAVTSQVVNTPRVNVRHNEKKATYGLKTNLPLALYIELQREVYGASEGIPVSISRSGIVTDMSGRRVGELVDSVGRTYDPAITAASIARGKPEPRPFFAIDLVRTTGSGGENLVFTDAGRQAVKNFIEAGDDLAKAKIFHHLSLGFPEHFSQVTGLSDETTEAEYIQACFSIEGRSEEGLYFVYQLLASAGAGVPVSPSDEGQAVAPAKRSSVVTTSIG